MPRPNRLLAAPFLVPLLALAAGCATMDTEPKQQMGFATLSLANGTQIGTVRLIEAPAGMDVDVNVSGIEPGLHGFHLHTTGSCIAPDFSSAGGHLNPTNATHGLQSPGGSHVGDLPNLHVVQNGSADFRFTLDGDTDQLRDWIFDSDGTAVVIHAKADDYRTNPAGDAGSRIACGVLTRS